MKRCKTTTECGVTYVEILVVTGIVAILFAFVYVSLLNVKPTASLQTTITSLASDLRQQQMKAMIGDTEGRATTDTYGIYFQPTSYVLFHGASYAPLDTSNFVVNLDDNLQFSSISLPSSSIIFAKGSGEVVGYSASQNTVTLRNTASGTTKTFQFNVYGSLVQVN